MIALGIVLLVIAVLVGIGVSTSTQSATREVFGLDLGMAASAVFYLGAAFGIAAVAGVWLTKKGFARGYRRRKEVRELRQQATAPSAPSALSAPSAPSAPSSSPASSAGTDRDAVASGTDSETPER
jgi:hypothetical protein